MSCTVVWVMNPSVLLQIWLLLSNFYRLCYSSYTYLTILLNYLVTIPNVFLCWRHDKTTNTTNVLDVISFTIKPFEPFESAKHFWLQISLNIRNDFLVVLFSKNFNVNAFVRFLNPIFFRRYSVTHVYNKANNILKINRFHWRLQCS